MQNNLILFAPIKNFSLSTKNEYSVSIFWLYTSYKTGYTFIVLNPHSSSLVYFNNNCRIFIKISRTLVCQCTVQQNKVRHQSFATNRYTGHTKALWSYFNCKICIVPIQLIIVNQQSERKGLILPGKLSANQKKVCQFLSHFVRSEI